MDSYDLISHDRCDRCLQVMASKIMSYFNDALICMECLSGEREVLAALRAKRVDVTRLASCGYVPVAEAVRSRGPDRGHEPERRRPLPLHWPAAQAATARTVGPQPPHPPPRGEP